MAWKVRDPGGTLRTIIDAKVRDAGGTLRTLVAKVRDGAGTLQTVHTGVAGPSGTYISPDSSSTSSSISTAHTGTFTANHPAGAATYLWGAENGLVVSGGTSQVAQLRVSDPGRDGVSSFASFWCDVTQGGITTRAYCSMEHNYLSSPGDGPEA